MFGYLEVYVFNVKGEWIYFDFVILEIVMVMVFICFFGVICVLCNDGLLYFDVLLVVNMVWVWENGLLVIEVELMICGEV